MRSTLTLIVLLAVVATTVGACIPGADASLAPGTPGMSASGEPSPGGSAGPSSRPSFTRPTPTPLPTFLVHVVAPGETLTAIARRYATSAFSLSVWNRAAYSTLDPLSGGYAPDAIQVGWQLRVIPGVEADEEELFATPQPGAGATASAGASPISPSPSSEPASPGPSVGGAAAVIRHGPRDVPVVALTFDMGGRLDPAQDILAWLVDNEVPATIFPTGGTGAMTAEGLAALEVVAEHRDLLDLGNHSWSHPDFRELDAAAMRDQLERTEEAVLELTGRSTVPWFRPPFGALDEQIPAVVGAAGWTSIVLWDIDTIDWRPIEDGGPTADEIVGKVLERAQGGSIVLLHLGGYETLEALPGIVEGLRARGLEPVTLDTMLGP